MTDYPTRESGPTGRMYRQGILARICIYTGAEVLGCITRQTCDTLWVRFPEEVQYQIRVVYLSAMMQKAIEPWKMFQEGPNILSRPISD